MIQHTSESKALNITASAGDGERERERERATVLSRKTTWLGKRWEYIFIALVSMAGCCLFLGNLGNQCLWQDEAQTALISKTILTHKVPLGYDGKNYFSQDLGAEYDKNYLWKWHPWLQFYLVAAAFKLLGISTFTARLPFALFGLASVILCYYAGKAIWKDRWAAALAAVLLLLSVPFLLLSRQCRYYSPAAFFPLLGMYAYLEYIDNKKGFVLLLAVAAFILFHIQFIFWAAFLGSILIHTLLFHRNKLLPLLVICFIIALLSLPWLIWVYNIDYSKVHPQIFTFKSFTRSIEQYCYLTARYIFFLPLLLIPLLLRLGQKWRKKQKIFRPNPAVQINLWLLIIFILVNYVVISLVGYFPFFRNLTVLIPVFALLSGYLITAAFKASKIAGAAIIVAMVLLSPLFNFLYEITHDYNGPMEGMANYLNQHGDKNDVVAISYGDMPLKFYTPMRIIGGMTGEDLRPALQAKWVILRKYIISNKNAVTRKYLVDNISWDKYRRIEIDYPDIPFENREDPKNHRYRTVSNEDRINIFERIR